MESSIISVKNLSKSYRLGVIGRKTLQDELRYRWLKLTGKDPEKFMGTVGKVSTEESRIGEEGQFWALKDISFEVIKGEVVGIIGRNGAGKSTLLKILTRITEPTSGDAVLNGRVASLLEIGTGFHGELTGRENIYLNGSILGMKKAEINRRYDEIVDFAEIGEFIDTPVKRYSSGMYVRLAFAVAAHLEPEILLVDEVLAVGDVEFQRKCMGKMTDVAEQGRTILFVSHNMAAIRGLCDRAILLDKGHVIMDAGAAETVSKYLEQNLVKGVKAGRVDIEKRLEGKFNKKDRHIIIHEVMLTNKHGEAQKNFYSDEPVNAVVTFECLKPILNLGILFCIVTEDNEEVVASHSTDDGTAGIERQNLEHGTYRVKCTFPPCLFGEKPSFLTLHMVVPKTEHLVLNKILELGIKFSGYNGVYTGGKVYIRPKLAWSLEQMPH